MENVPPPAELAEILNGFVGGFDKLIGLKFTEARLGELVAEVEIGPQHLQPHGIVHGGLYATIVETMGSVGASVQVWESGKAIVGLDNNTSFYRATGEGTLTAKAAPVKLGRRSQVWRTDIFGSNGKLMASGQLRILVIEKDTLPGKTAVTKD